MTALSTWDGQDPNGSWQLAILDQVRRDNGQLNSWGLRVCIDEVNTCNLNVTSTLQNGEGSLLDAISCASSGDVITLDPSLRNQNIDIGTSTIVIDKVLTIQADPDDNIGIDYFGTSSALLVKSGGEVTIKGSKINQN